MNGRTTSHFALRTLRDVRKVRIELDEQGKMQLMGVKDRLKREPALPKKFRDALDTKHAHSHKEN